MFFIPFNIKALNGGINLNCSSTTLKVGTKANCTLSGFSDKGISSLSAKLSSNGGVIISNISVSSIWQGDSGEGNIDLYTDDNKKGNFSIVTFSIQANSEGNVNVSGVTFYDEDFKEYSMTGKAINIKINNDVDSNVNSDNNTNANVNTNSNTNTNTSNNNNNNTNNIIESKKNNDANLKSLVISNGDISFSSDVTDYVVEVSNDVSSIQISALANDSKALVEYPDNLDLQLGDNNVSILVTAEDGTKKNYNIKIVRLEKVLSNDSSLINLSVVGYNLDFSSDKFVYNLGDIASSSLIIDAVSNDSDAVVNIYGNNSIGDNDVVLINVVAQDGSSSDYMIFVNNIEKNFNSINWIFIIVIVVLIFSLFLNLLLIFKNKKNNKNEEIEKIDID